MFCKNIHNNIFRLKLAGKKDIPLGPEKQHSDGKKRV